MGERELEMLAAAFRKRILSYGLKPRTPGEIYVTDIVNCPRRAFFNIQFNANPIANEGSALVGIALHKMIPLLFNDVFHSPKYEHHVEKDLGGGWKLTGRIDVLDETRDGRRIVYEFKFGNLYSDAKPLYIQQANAYACLAGADEWRLVIIDMKRLIVGVDAERPDKKMFDRFMARAYRLVEAINKGTVPAPTEFKWECEHCPYNIICVRWREWLQQKHLET